MIIRLLKREILIVAVIFYIFLSLLHIITQLSMVSHLGTPSQYPLVRNNRASSPRVKHVPPLGNVDSWRRVTSPEGLVGNSFYRLRSVHDGRWLGHASSGVYGAISERTLAVIHRREAGGYVIQAWSTLFLSVRLHGLVAMDCTTERDAEVWEFHFVPGEGTVKLHSIKRRCVVQISGDRLVCRELRERMNASAPIASSQWEMYVELRKACRSLKEGEDWSSISRACWGLTVAAQRNVVDEIILFGTPKPLKSLTADANDAYDPFRILNRTLFNWALIDGVQPVVITDEILNRKLVEEINELNRARGIGRNIDVITEFEVHKNFGQPTYRGLFIRVMLAYPDAQFFVYSNMDILFSRSMLNTVDAIQYYYSALSELNASKKGWFAVGRRINVNIPLNWHLDIAWTEHTEVLFRTVGVPFQALSEDYFAVTRSVFDWKKIPDFVVGGTAFDNWLTTQAVSLARSGLALTVDATLTLTAVHQNHGEDAKKSHGLPKSRYNNILAQRNGGWALGRTTDAPFMTVGRFGDEIVVLNKHSLLLE